MSATTLAVGQIYEREFLQVEGWTEGDGTGHDGYNWADYFDAEGRYLGADVHGIEPLFINHAAEVTE